MKTQRHKIYVSLTFVLLWLCSLLGTPPDITVSFHKKGDPASFSIAKASVAVNILGEEELSRTFFAGEIKLLPSGLPLPGLPDDHLLYRAANTLGSTYSGDTADLRQHIEQLIFPFHFFY